jgi:hypothetical protein
MLNPNRTYAGSNIENFSNGKKEIMPTEGISFGRFISKNKNLLLSVLELKNNSKFKNLKINFK